MFVRGAHARALVAPEVTVHGLYGMLPRADASVMPSHRGIGVNSEALPVPPILHDPGTLLLATLLLATLSMLAFMLRAGRRQSHSLAPVRGWRGVGDVPPLPPSPTVAGVDDIASLQRTAAQLRPTWTSAVGKHELYAVPCERNVAILAAAPSVMGYRPTPYMNGHVQTFYGVMARTNPRLQPAKHTRAHLDDGGQLAVDWFPVPPRAEAAPRGDARAASDDTASARRPVLVIIPGTRGTRETIPVQWMIIAAHTAGYDVAVTALRGCGVTSLATPRCFDGADYMDLAAALRVVSTELAPGAELYAVGYSMGGGMLAHFIAAGHAPRCLRAAIALSSTPNYAAAVEYMHTHPVARAYNFMLTNVVKLSLWRQRHLFGDHPHVRLPHAWRANSIRDWQAAVTCRLRGIDSPHAFNKEVCAHLFCPHPAMLCSHTHKGEGCARQHDDARTAVVCVHVQVSFDHLLKDVRIPLLMINAKDDVVCPHWSVPAQEAQRNPWLWCLKTSTGGHTGFCTGWDPRRFSWDNEVVIDFFNAVRATQQAQHNPTAATSGDTDTDCGCDSNAQGTVPSSPSSSDPQPLVFGQADMVPTPGN
ncbi:alpha/beta fold hydrolase [archaeon]|nr:MAG: alpha/beta fold hydrolase [archaeon]